MSKTAILRTRIEPRRKVAAETVLRKLGVTPTQAVNMLYAQIVQRRGLPFAVAESDADYFVSEYGLTPAQSIKAGIAMRKETVRARRTGKLREVTKLADLTP